MECITISSDDEEIQILTVKVTQTPIKSEPNGSPNFKRNVKEEPVNSVHSIRDDKSQLKDLSADKSKFLQNNELVPVITLVDDASFLFKSILSRKRDLESDENELVKNRTDQMKCKNDLYLQKSDPLRSVNDSNSASKNVRNGEIKHDVKQSMRNKNSSSEEEIKGAMQSRSNVEKLEDQESENISNGPLVTKLLELCRRGEYGDEMAVVERKIWKYFNAASPAKTQTVEFKLFLESCISKIENIFNSTKDKFLISRIIKEFITEMKNDPNVMDDKLRKLYSVYNKLVRRITKLEEAEVESDDDGGNPYIYLDRYRKKAVEVYNKICELEGRSSDADRPTQQRFFFTGSSAPIPVQRALEKYYNKTRIFPDFYDVKKLVKKINKEENLSLSENQILKTAQNVFMEFGERLVKRRKYDDYNILVDYLKEDQCVDPAEFDTDLQMKLELNKRTRKKEQEVLDNFALLEANSGKKENDKSENNEEKKNLAPEKSAISLSSSSSSLASSPANVSAEESKDSDEEDCETIEQKNHDIVIFSDSEEELTMLEAEDKKRRINLIDSSRKRLKTGVVNCKEIEPSSEVDSNELEVKDI